MKKSVKTELIDLAAPTNGLSDPVYRKLAERYSTADAKASLLELVTPWAESVISYDEPAAWLPVHAWRILAVQREPDVLHRLLVLADHPDDYLVYGEFAAVAALIGERATPTLIEVLRSKQQSEIQRILAAKGMAAIAIAHPDAKPAATHALILHLETAVLDDGDVSAAVTEALMELEAVEAGPTVWTAYSAGLINLGIGAESLLARSFPRSGDS